MICIDRISQTDSVKPEWSGGLIIINAKFLELPEEKQRAILNAGFEVFAKSEYKRASTEEIAAKAGISKGLLFYYFHDKKTFYLFLFEQAAERIKSYVMDDAIGKIDDFFEMCAYAAQRKCLMLGENPCIMDFIVRVFYAQQKDTPKDINGKFLEEAGNIFGTYFKNIDFSKFRADVDPQEIFRMLAWMAEGYLSELKMAGQAVSIQDIMEKYKLWSAYLKRVSYKEEYLT
jgi:AcrR family transcriptional regulator